MDPLKSQVTIEISLATKTGVEMRGRDEKGNDVPKGIVGRVAFSLKELLRDAKPCAKGTCELHGEFDLMGSIEGVVMKSSKAPAAKPPAKLERRPSKKGSRNKIEPILERDEDESIAADDDDEEEEEEEAAPPLPVGTIHVRVALNPPPPPSKLPPMLGGDGGGKPPEDPQRSMAGLAAGLLGQARLGSAPPPAAAGCLGSSASYEGLDGYTPADGLSGVGIDTVSPDFGGGVGVFSPTLSRPTPVAPTAWGEPPAAEGSGRGSPRSSSFQPLPPRFAPMMPPPNAPFGLARGSFVPPPPAYPPPNVYAPGGTPSMLTPGMPPGGFVPGEFGLSPPSSPPANCDDDLEGIDDDQQFRGPSLVLGRRRASHQSWRLTTPSMQSPPPSPPEESSQEDGAPNMAPTTAPASIQTPDAPVPIRASPSLPVLASGGPVAGSAPPSRPPEVRSSPPTAVGGLSAPPSRPEMRSSETRSNASHRGSHRDPDTASVGALSEGGDADDDGDDAGEAEASNMMKGKMAGNTLSLLVQSMSTASTIDTMKYTFAYWIKWKPVEGMSDQMLFFGETRNMPAL